ncbi:unnamed protein product [Lactuca virosa]|uniref:Uncharacterized protein n=1 Tax=Lactuca virosa TaxID=75947 RepID=A0AAU9LJE4_9ASTR|nr:unnamed protein product [Lactuca virosa]
MINYSEHHLQRGLLDSSKENWDIPAPPNGTKFHLWPSAIYPVKSSIDIEEMAYAFFQGKRTNNYEFMFSEAEFPRINQGDIRSLIIWLKLKESTNEAYADALQRLRQYILYMVIHFIVDWEIGQLGEKIVHEPDLDLNVENESPGNILKTPHRGVVFFSKS